MLAHTVDYHRIDVLPHFASMVVWWLQLFLFGDVHGMTMYVHVDMCTNCTYTSFPEASESDDPMRSVIRVMLTRRCVASCVAATRQHTVQFGPMM